MMTKLIYLASPYSHHDAAVRQLRFEIVSRVAARLMSGGLHVFSPISHTHPIAEYGSLPLGWDFWEQYDRAIMGVCSRMIVLMLDGWEQSRGVQAEVSLAVEFGLDIEYMHYDMSSKT